MPKKFSASNASMFMHCHASANLPVAIPGWTPPVEDPSTDNAANRGTKMHTIFAALMDLPLSDAQRMIEAQQYVAAIRQQRRFKALVEVPDVADWLPSSPTTTADLVLYLSDEIHVFDLKTGKIPVAAVGNDQMMFYGATYLKYAPKAKSVHLHIVQPWADVVEQWVVSLNDLYHWMHQAILHDLKITDGDVTFGPGDHCLFCPANPRGRGAKGSPLCPVLMEMYYPSMPLDHAAIIESSEEE